MVGTELLGIAGPALPPAWCGYRDGFAVLQYLHTLGDGVAGKPICWPRLVVDLGFEEWGAEGVLRYLLASGCVVYCAGARCVALTPLGLAYLDGGRGRRRSLRPVGAPRIVA